MKRGRREGLVAGTRGAVYVEFIAAFLPLFILFESLVQMAGVYTAKLVVLHSAATAARAAVVVLHDDPKFYDDVEVGKLEGKRREDIEQAAAVPLMAVRSIVKFDLTFPSQAGGTDDRKAIARDDLVRVRVEATYKCAVPIAKRMVCDPFTTRKKLVGEAALPNNGVSYEYSP